MAQTYDRGAQDIGNIVALEHVNVRFPSQQLATAFSGGGLGFSGAPSLRAGLENMGITVGQQRFHLPTADPQVLRGHVGLVVPDLDALTARLAAVKGALGGTAFDYSVENGHVTVTSPWGNRRRCHPPGPQLGDMTLGMPHVEFPVAGSACSCSTTKCAASPIGCTCARWAFARRPSGSASTRAGGTLSSPEWRNGARLKESPHG